MAGARGSVSDLSPAPLVLCLDAGNTNLKVGLFAAGRLVAGWSAATDARRTADDYGLLLDRWLAQAAVDRGAVGGVAICSVVPALTPALQETSRRYLGRDPLLITGATDSGLANRYQDAGQLGADRLANAVALRAHCDGPACAIDFGTATKLDAVDGGAYLGGSISPGLAVWVTELNRRVPGLPRADLAAPVSAVGRGSDDSLRSGIILGYAAWVDGLLARLGREMTGPPAVMATGGLADLVVPYMRRAPRIVPHLTLQGIYLLYERNRLATRMAPHAALG